MIPTRIGQQTLGGTFTGFNRIRHRVFSIIVAPKHAEIPVSYFDSGYLTVSRSTIDGARNTTKMATDNFPAAVHCKELTINGYKDWYIPSKNEMLLCYRYLKPEDDYNAEYSFVLDNKVNRSSIPTNLSELDTLPFDPIQSFETVVFDFKFFNWETPAKNAFNKEIFYLTSTKKKTDINPLMFSFNSLRFRNTDFLTLVTVRPVRRQLVVKAKR